MTRLTRFVLRHRRWVVASWLAMLVIGGIAARSVGGRLDYAFALPGQPGYEASMKILQSYRTTSQQGPVLLVLSAPAGQALPQAEADRTFTAVARDVPRIRVVGRAQTGDGVFRTRDGRTEFAFAFLPPPTADQTDLAPLRTALLADAPQGTTARVSGLPALRAGGSDSGPGVFAETVIGGIGALAVLAFVFASVLALVPLLVAAVSIMTAFLVLLGLTYLGNVSFVVEFLIALVGLGVAIDYSLLVVTRWREERGRGVANSDAVLTAMQTAGRAVVFSGLTVAVSLIVLVVLPVPFLRSIGYGGALIPLISVGVAVTLLPALLGGLGPRVDRPRTRRRDRASRFWLAWARLVVRRRWLATGGAVVVLVALIVPLTSIRIGEAQSSSLAHGGPAFDGLHQLQRGGVPDGVLTPIEILTTEAAGPATVARVRAVPGVTTAILPSGEVAHRGGTALIDAVPRVETANGSSLDVVRAVRSALAGAPGVLGIAGMGSVQLDYRTGVLDKFPLALLLVVLITYLLLVRTFRSLLLPAKAVLLNLVSVAATFGAMVLFWQDGHGSQTLYGIAPTGAITFWLPQMVFAFLFGLSMDYEVFILARMREEYDATGSTEAAVVTAVSRTGRLITSAALILFLAFLSLASGPQTELKVFATGLGFGILLDATVIRMLLVPALVSLFGTWNWYLPGAVARLLRVPAPHPRPQEAQDPQRPSRQPEPTATL
jgi:putative drug exporter of the RND superfamily